MEARILLGIIYTSIGTILFLCTIRQLLFTRAVKLKSLRNLHLTNSIPIFLGVIYSIILLVGSIDGLILLTILMTPVLNVPAVVLSLIFVKTNSQLLNLISHTNYDKKTKILICVILTCGCLEGFGWIWYYYYQHTITTFILTKIAADAGRVVLAATVEWECIKMIRFAKDGMKTSDQQDTKNMLKRIHRKLMIIAVSVMVVVGGYVFWQLSRKFNGEEALHKDLTSYKTFITAQGLRLMLTMIMFGYGFVTSKKMKEMSVGSTHQRKTMSYQQSVNI